ncbi:uncharacterized protein JCM15063_003430 [Sporobolomyces koalae]|uniref:uncharacterized protein n=1 Tax=Sporobolomyces koalae TaxID=500713 RepID=UPI003180C28A
MIRRRAQQQQRAQQDPQWNRTPALIIAFSSLLLSSGLATTLYVVNAAVRDQLDGDLDQAAVVAWWTGDAAFKWAVISATGSLAGVIGIFTRNAAMHRIFAVSTFADLLLTFLLTFTLSLLTFTPSLAPTFGSLLCSSVLFFDYSPAATGPILRERESSSWAAAGGIDIMSWGVEACEESWQSGMYKVIAGCVIAAGLRIYGVWVSWEMNAELREREYAAVGDAWVDDGPEMISDRDSEMQQVTKTSRGLEEALSSKRRTRSFSSSSSGQQSRSEGSWARRSNTLPSTGLPPRYSDPALARPRSQSSSASTSSKPRLVLLPVYVDRHGNPIGSPSNAHPPAYQSRSSTVSASASLPPRSPSRSKQSSSRSSPSPPPPPSNRQRTYPHSPRSRGASSPALSPTKSPSPPLYCEEPVCLSPTEATTTGCTSKPPSPASNELNGRSRRARHRTDTDGNLLGPIPVVA